jgi:hypothetical protein
VEGEHGLNMAAVEQLKPFPAGAARGEEFLIADMGALTRDALIVGSARDL